MAENRKQRKQARKEARKHGSLRLSRTARVPADPLGYDTREFWPMVDRMLDDVRTGRTTASVDAELARIRARYKKTAKPREEG
jgi:hypothetical protein